VEPVVRVQARLVLRALLVLAAPAARVPDPAALAPAAPARPERRL
jgi:hypothetical protein